MFVRAHAISPPFPLVRSSVQPAAPEIGEGLRASTASPFMAPYGSTDRSERANASSNDTADATTRARARLAEIKAHLDFLERHGFPSQVIARFSQSIGTALKQISADATSATPAAPGGSDMAAPSIVSKTSGGSALDAASVNEEAHLFEEAPEKNDPRGLPGAYLEMLNPRTAEASGRHDDLLGEVRSIKGRIRVLLGKDGSASSDAAI